MRKTEINIKISCNRCGHEDTWINETPEYLRWEWSEVVYGEEKEHHKRVRFDLCPSCTREVKTWIRNGR